MQHEENFLDLLRRSPEEVRLSILSSLSYDILTKYYNYICYRSQLEKVAHPEDELLGKLGYNINDRAFPVLRDLILYITEAIEEKGVRAASKLAKDENSYIYVELAHYDYEIGLNNLRSELNRIHSERNINNIELATYNDVFGKKYERNVYDAAISIAKYIKNQEKESSEQTKTGEDKAKVVDSSNKVLALA